MHTSTPQPTHTTSCRTDAQERDPRGAGRVLQEPRVRRVRAQDHRAGPDQDRGGHRGDPLPGRGQKPRRQSGTCLSLSLFGGVVAGWLLMLLSLLWCPSCLFNPRFTFLCCSSVCLSAVTGLDRRLQAAHGRGGPGGGPQGDHQRRQPAQQDVVSTRCIFVVVSHAARPDLHSCSRLILAQADCTLMRFFS